MAATAPLKPKHTPQQQAAIGTTKVSVALAAGAGCGKTFVLTERFLSCLDPARSGGPLRLDQLTAITFTERAAREMRERIRTACTDRLLNAEEAHANHWLRTIRELDSARISTIHSFCGSLLRSHAVEARIDPHFQVLDATATQTLLFELLDDQLRERLAAREEAVLRLVVTYGLRSLREMIGHLLSERQTIDWERWRKETPEQLVARWSDFWKTNALPRVLAKVADSPAAKAILEIVGREMPSHATMRERCDILLDKLPKLVETTDPLTSLAEIHNAARVQGGGAKKAWSSEDVYISFQNAAKELRGTIDKVKEQAAFDPVAARPAAETALDMLAVTQGVSEAFQKRKDELAALDFDDLLIRARELLTAENQGDLRKRLAAQTKLLLVDEFQDTDPLQVELVRALCDGRVTEGKLFFVGDHKQSIYRFRGADPHVFRRLRDEIPALGRLPLTLNFRSQPEVLEFVNALFCDELGSDYEPLKAHRKQLGPVPAVEFLWAEAPPDAESEGDDAEETTAAVPSAAWDDDGGSPAKQCRRREADWIARRIRGMLDSGEALAWDEEAARTGQPKVRPVRPGDIALLFRALTNVEYYEEALRRHGIDYYLVGGHAFYAQQEIYDVVNLLRTLASPCDEVSLAGVLRSPMFGLLDETLYRLAKHGGGLAEGLERLSSSSRGVGLDKEQHVKAMFATVTLRELREKKDRVPIVGLLQDAFHRTGYDALLLSEFLGERKLANLHKLIDQARQFDASGIFTLSDFIVQLAQFVARQPDEPLAAMQSESIDAVRLMSIHQSKGLEFPIVFVVDVDRPRRHAGNQVAFDAELGPMVRLSGCTSGYDLFMQAEADEEMAELSRLLYVAATRAADYLVISAGFKALEKTRGPWMAMLKRRFDLERGAALKSPNTVLAKVSRQAPPLIGSESVKEKRHDLNAVLEKAKKLVAAGKGIVPDHLGVVPPEVNARRQYSFSRLRGSLHLPPNEVPMAAEAFPSTEPTVRIDSLGLGTLVHAVLADLTVASDNSPTSIETLVLKHSRRQLIEGSAEIESANDLINRLTGSPRWAAIRSASQLHPELEFLLAWPPNYNGGATRVGATPAPQLDTTYIQGFMDCLYQDGAGGWHLIDYKTNKVTQENVAETATEHYEMQMLLYGLAMETIWGVAPVELVLHFLEIGFEWTLEWNAGARQRAIEQVNDALERLKNAYKTPSLGPSAPE